MDAETVGVNILQADELLRVVDRKVAEEENVDGGEDERVRADSEGQQEHDDGGEGGVAG